MQSFYLKQFIDPFFNIICKRSRKVGCLLDLVLVSLCVSIKRGPCSLEEWWIWKWKVTLLLADYAFTCLLADSPPSPLEGSKCSHFQLSTEWFQVILELIVKCDHLIKMFCCSHFELLNDFWDPRFDPKRDPSMFHGCSTIEEANLLYI